MENNNSSLYAQKAVESFYLDRPYGIRIDYSRKGFVLFNRKLNLLGMDKWNSIEELPLEEYDNPEEIPVEGMGWKILRNGSKYRKYSPSSIRNRCSSKRRMLESQKRTHCI